MRIILFAFCLLIVSPVHSFAQKKIKTLDVSDTIVFATVDRVGELYVVTKHGQIQRFDTQGTLLAIYKNGPAPTLFEGRDGARLFAFFKKERAIQVLNPSFEVVSSFKIDSAFINDPWLACASGDHNFWVIDAADRTLKKINPRTGSVDVDVKLPQQLSSDIKAISSIREYQGFVFILDSLTGIHILNGMGNWLKSESGANLPYFNFIGEELYYPSQQKLNHLNLFTTEKREVLLKVPFSIALVTDERLYTIKHKTIVFFEYKP
jgi:hypothetical protein